MEYVYWNYSCELFTAPLPEAVPEKVDQEEILAHHRISQYRMYAFPK